jgi:hypothetical protein
LTPRRRAGTLALIISTTNHTRLMSARRPFSLLPAPIVLTAAFLALTAGSPPVSAQDPAAKSAPAKADEELPSIFNGKDLTGWKAPSPNPFWRVENGILIGENNPEKKGSMLYTEKSYQDVIVEADVRWTGEIDSGFMVRKPEIQMQIGVSRSLKRDMTCSFYVGKYPEAGQAKDAEKKLKAGDWNKMRLQAKGDTFTVWLNGEKVSEFTDAKYSSAGPIGLQIHPGLPMKVEFRNIKAKELK